jgi:hypothetical protein
MNLWRSSLGIPFRVEVLRSVTSFLVLLLEHATGTEGRGVEGRWCSSPLPLHLTFFPSGVGFMMPEDTWKAFSVDCV